MTFDLHARKSIFGPAFAGTISAAATRHVIAIALPIDPTNPKTICTRRGRHQSTFSENGRRRRVREPSRGAGKDSPAGSTSADRLSSPQREMFRFYIADGLLKSNAFTPQL